MRARSSKTTSFLDRQSGRDTPDWHSSQNVSGRLKVRLVELHLLPMVMLVVMAACTVVPAQPPTPEPPTPEPPTASSLSPQREDSVLQAPIPLPPTRSSMPSGSGSMVEPASELTAEALEQEAFAVARQTIEDFPDTSDPLGLMGTVHHQFDNDDEAVEWWERVLQRNPRRADAYIGMAAVAADKEDYEKSIELCRKAQEIAPDLVDVDRRLAEALVAVGRPEEAIEILDRAVRNFPNASEAYYLLGQSYLQLKQYDQAVTNYAKALALRPRYTNACFGLATAYSRLRQREKAAQYRKTFQELRAAELESVERVKRNRAKRVDTDLDHAIRVVAKTRGDAGQVYRGHGWLHEAQQHWLRAAALDPKNQTSRKGLVELYMQRGQREEAVEICRQLIEIAPHNALYHSNTGVLLAQLQRFDEAEQSLRKGVELAPKNASGYRPLLEVLMYGSKDFAQAKAVGKQFVELEPTAGNYAILSEACDRDGDLPGALAAIGRAAELDPESGHIKNAQKWLRAKEAGKTP